MNENQRCEMLLGLSCVDRTVVYGTDSFYWILKDIDVLVMGEEHSEKHHEAIQKAHSVYLLPRTEGISDQIIRDRIFNRYTSS